MEKANSSNYNLIENELGFSVSQLDGQNFDVIVSTDYSLNLGVNSNNGTAKTPFSNQLTSTWMNDITSVGNCDQFDFVNNEMVIDASEGFTDKTDNDDFTSELNISDLNTGNRNGFNGSQADDTSNGHLSQLISDDFAFSKAKHFDLVKEDTCNVSFKNGKASETLTQSDETDGFSKAFDEPLHSNIQMRKDRPVESAYFEIKKYSGLVSNDERENMNSVQTDNEFTNVASRKETKQLSSVTESDDHRIIRTRKRRGKTRFQSTNFVDLSPVPSPEAEIPSSSLITSNKYIRDDELITLDTKELNRRVKNWPKAIVQHIKYRRRTLKNRWYARSCREKKNTETSTLQKTKGDLEKQFASTSFELQLEKLRRDDWKSKYEKLTSTLQQQGIQIQQ